MYINKIFLILLFSLANNVFAGQHTYEELDSYNSKKAVLCVFSGVIETGDTEKLQNNIAKTGCTVMNIGSSGGSVQVAMDMGRVIRRNKIFVWSDKQENCASSCVFLYAAGVQRIAFGMILIHRPYLLTTGGSMETTQDKYRNIEANAKKYLREMNVSETLFDLMMSIPPESVRALELAEMDKLGMGRVDPVYQEYRDNLSASKIGLTKVKFLEMKQEKRKACGKVNGDTIPEQEIERITACWKRIEKNFVKNMQ